MALGDCEGSSGCIKLNLFVHLAPQNYQKLQEIPKIGGLNLFEYLSDFDEIKTFVILTKIWNFSSYKIFLNLLLFEISSFKNADVCLEVHFNTITTV